MQASSQPDGVNSSKPRNTSKGKTTARIISKNSKESGTAGGSIQRNLLELEPDDRAGATGSKGIKQTLTGKKASERRADRLAIEEANRILGITSSTATPSASSSRKTRQIDPLPLPAPLSQAKPPSSPSEADPNPPSDIDIDIDIDTDSDGDINMVGSATKSKSKRPSSEIAPEYLNTFTTVLDYPKPEHLVPNYYAARAHAQARAQQQQQQQVLQQFGNGNGNGNGSGSGFGGDGNAEASGSGTGSVGGRSQRQSKVDAIGRMDGTLPNTSTQNPFANPNPTNPAAPLTDPLIDIPNPFPTGISLLPPIKPNIQSSSSSHSSPTPPPANIHNNPQLKKLAVQPSQPLRAETVRWMGPREPAQRTKERMWGLKECKVFYPTVEEFKDPMEYVKKIGEEGGARDWGMAKVVPPEGWKMPFVLDTETFRFQTRLQRLNSIEAASRAKLNFLDQLYMYHKQQGNDNVHIPVFDNRPVDIWSLRKEVGSQGGFDRLCANKAWGNVATSLGFKPAHAPSLKNTYVKIVQPFDDFYAKVKGQSAALAGYGNILNKAKDLAPVAQLKKEAQAQTPAYGLGDSPLTPLTETVPAPSGSGLNQAEQIRMSALAREKISQTPSKSVGNSSALDGDAGSDVGSASPEGSEKRKGMRVVPGSPSGNRTGTPTSDVAGPSKAPVSIASKVMDRERSGTASSSNIGGSGPAARMNPFVSNGSESSDLSEVDDEDEDDDMGIVRPSAVSGSVGSGTDRMSPDRGGKRKRRGDNGHGPSTPPAKRPTRNGRGRADLKYEKGDICEICLNGRDAAKILLCDECERGFHIYCLTPPLSQIPDNDEWFCPSCLLSMGNDYGFDEGEEHSIHSFQQRANSFKLDWFMRHPPKSNQEYDFHAAYQRQMLPPGVQPNGVGEFVGPVFLTEDDIEREFWRLVESQYTSVEVEYGADIHSTTHGSAAPTLETHPLNPYAADPWNLNNLPILPQSLLRYIKSDISGMTVPWTYIGMLFSTFCWHNEDHHTYSINYMHWGDTKTWYTIPGSAAAKFEEAIRGEAPELFEQQPSLLFQLVTLMNPGRLKELGVDISVCDQRANEFVITWPKAYHCGFNHGFNLNEAVNFALPDWLNLGRECVQQYSIHGKSPVFSHEELLVTISQYSDTVETAVWLHHELSSTIARELEKRDKVRKNAPRISETLEVTDLPEEQYICYACKAFCYLSQVTCRCTSRVVCPDHADQLCKCSPSLRTLRKRYSESQLVDIQSAVAEKAAIPTTWRSRFDTILSETARPPIKALRTLVSEGEKIMYPLPELASLRAFVVQVNSWLSRATGILSKKKPGRKRKVRDEDGDFLMDDGTDAGLDGDRKPSAGMISDLLTAAERLAFDAPEIAQIRQLVMSVQDFQSKAEDLFAQPEADVEMKLCQQLYFLGESINVDVPEMTRLDTIIKRKEWVKAMEEVDEDFMTIEDIQRNLVKADSLDIPADHDFVRELEAKAARGEAWKARAEALLFAVTPDDYQYLPRTVTLQQLEEMTTDDRAIPNMGSIHSQLQDVRKRALGVVNSCQLVLASQDGTPKSILTVRKLLRTADTKAPGIVIPEIDVIEKIVGQYDDWVARVGKLLGNSDDPASAIPAMIKKVKQLLDPEDDEYPEEFNAILVGTKRAEAVAAAATRFNCLCRLPPSRAMLQCRKCLELYHPGCLDPAYVESPNSRIIKCPFCRTKDPQGQKPQPRPSLLKFAPLLDDRFFDLSFKFEEVNHIKELMDICARAAKLVLPKVSPNENEVKTEDLRFLRHWLRKLRDLPVNIEVRPAAGANVSLYPALLGRLKDLRRPQTMPLPPAETDCPGTPPGLVREALDEARKRHNWPYFAFDQVAREGAISCICATPPPQDYIKVHCKLCSQGFHAACVVAPTACLGSNPRPWLCPLCSVNDGVKYETAEVRCQFREHVGTGICIDTAMTLQNGKDVVTNLQEDPPPLGYITLVVKAFEPGKPGIPGSVSSRFQPRYLPSSVATSVTLKDKQNQLGILQYEKEGKARKPKKPAAPAVRGVPNMSRAGKKPTGDSQSSRMTDTPPVLPILPNIHPGHLPPASGPMRHEPYMRPPPLMPMLPGHMAHPPFPGQHPPYGSPIAPQRPSQEPSVASPTGPISPAVDRDMSRPTPPNRQLNSFTASMVIPPFRSKRPSDASTPQPQNGSPQHPQGQLADTSVGPLASPSPFHQPPASVPSPVQAQSEAAPSSIAAPSMGGSAAILPGLPAIDVATPAGPSDTQLPFGQQGNEPILPPA